MSKSVLLQVCRSSINCSRQLSFTPVLYKAQTASDPIQQLFLEKVRAYAQKSKAAGGNLVDATPDVETRYAAELDRVVKSFGVKAGEDFTKFPTLNFQDTELEPVGVTVDLKDIAADEVVAEQEADDTPFFAV